jgi:hypothetical protein
MVAVKDIANHEDAGHPRGRSPKLCPTQLAAYKRKHKRPVLTPWDRLFWVGLSQVWSGWRHVLIFVQPDTVVRWQRAPRGAPFQRDGTSNFSLSCAADGRGIRRSRNSSLLDPGSRWCLWECRDRECLNHFIILNARPLKRTLAAYFRYYHQTRPHLALEKQCPIERQIMKHGAVVEIPELGDLHHRYERIAACN